MSFSSDTKKELSELTNGARHCNIAEIAGMLLSSGSLYHDKEISLCFFTENEVIAEKFFTLILNTYKIECENFVGKHFLRKSYSNCYAVLGDEACKKVLLASGLLVTDGQRFQKAAVINPLVIQNTCCKRAFLRGVFLGSGYLANPRKTYHLELVIPNKKTALNLQQIINFFELNAKIVGRKNYFILYLKEGEQIVNFLNIMEAHSTLMEFENVRIVKEMRNDINRTVNFEMANFSKTIDAAVKQIEDIEYVFGHNGKNLLSKSLYETAQARIDFPEASLKEIGEMLTPAVSKSGVNHRLRKISKIAESLRETKGGRV